MKDKRLIKIVDTTLRDGEQRAGLAFSGSEKLACAMVMDRMGIYQIEAGIPAMCREEKDAIYEIMGHRKNAKISTWNRMIESDIESSLDICPDIIHIGVPVSDIQIKEKLHKTRDYVEEQMKKCILKALSGGSEVTLGFEDSSRADMAFMQQLAHQAASLGIKRIRYADTLGICSPSKIGADISELVRTDLEIECHTHDDLGMAVANSIVAAKNGAEFIDTTFLGIGERAGNCNFIKFITGAKDLFEFGIMSDFINLAEIDNEICGILGIGRKKSDLYERGADCAENRGYL